MTLESIVFPSAADLLRLLTENEAMVRQECGGMSLHGVNIVGSEGYYCEGARLITRTLSDGSKVCDLEFKFCSFEESGQ